MEEFRRKRQIEMTSVSNEIETRYQDKLQEQLQTMRADFDARIAQNRHEVDDMYKNKLSEAQDTANRNRATAAEVREELARYRTRTCELEIAVAAHDAKVESLNRQIYELEALIRRIRDESDIKIQQREDRIAELECEVNNMITEYRDLMDLKVQLDTELQAYHRLLEGEETRSDLVLFSDFIGFDCGFSIRGTRIKACFELVRIYSDLVLVEITPLEVRGTKKSRQVLPNSKYRKRKFKISQIFY
jgi:lamin B